MKTKMSAGAKLRPKLNRALAAAGDGFQFAAELAGQARTASLTRLAAEARQNERRVVELVDSVLGVAQPKKSARHQRAVRARWDRRDKREQARIGNRLVSVPMEGAR